MDLIRVSGSACMKGKKKVAGVAWWNETERDPIYQMPREASRWPEKRKSKRGGVESVDGLGTKKTRGGQLITSPFKPEAEVELRWGKRERNILDRADTGGGKRRERIWLQNKADRKGKDIHLTLRWSENEKTQNVHSIKKKERQGHRRGARPEGGGKKRRATLLFTIIREEPAERFVFQVETGKNYKCLF